MHIYKLMCFLCATASLLCVEGFSQYSSPKSPAAPKALAAKKVESAKNMQNDKETLDRVETVKDSTMGKVTPPPDGHPIPIGASF